MKNLGFWVFVFAFGFELGLPAAPKSCREEIITFARLYPAIDPDKQRLLHWAHYVDEAPPEAALAQAFQVLGLASKQIKSPATYSLVLDILSRKSFPISPKVAFNLSQLMILRFDGDRAEYDQRLKEFIGGLILNSPDLISAISNSHSDHEFGQIRIDFLTRLLDAIEWALETPRLSSAKRTAIVSELYMLRRDLLTIYYVHVRSEKAQLSDQLKALKNELSTRAFVGGDEFTSTVEIDQLRREISKLEDSSMIYSPEDNKKIEELSAKIKSWDTKMRAIRMLQSDTGILIDDYDGEEGVEFKAESFAERRFPSTEEFFDEVDKIRYEIFLMLEFSDSFKSLADDPRFLEKPKEFTASASVSLWANLEKIETLWRRVKELWSSHDTAGQHLTLIMLVKRMGGMQQALYQAVKEAGQSLESRDAELSSEFLAVAQKLNSTADIFIQREARFFESERSFDQSFSLLKQIEERRFDLFEIPENLWNVSLIALNSASIDPSLDLPRTRLVRRHIVSLIEFYKTEPGEAEKQEILKFAKFLDTLLASIVRELGSPALSPLKEFVLTKRAYRIYESKSFLISELSKNHHPQTQQVLDALGNMDVPDSTFLIYHGSRDLYDFAQRKSWVSEWKAKKVDFSTYPRERLEAWGATEDAESLPRILASEENK